MNIESKRLLAGIAGGLLLACNLAPAQAADLRVAPVIVEPLPGTRTSTLTLINEESRPLKAQIRVFRWTQENGQDVLVPTTDVVASPPFATLTPQEPYLVRLVRSAKTPPVGEESYRVLVDEVPDPANIRPGTVNLILRQSIPVFFSDIPRRSPQVEWSLQRDGERLWLTAANSGNRRIRVSDVMLSAGRDSVYSQPGLAGYVLPGSQMRWPITPTGKLPRDGKLRLNATADTGPVDVSLVARPGG